MNLSSFRGLNGGDTVYSDTVHANVTSSSYLNTAEIVTIMSLLIVLGFLGFIANLVVIISIIVRERSFEAPSNVFLLSLAVADLLISCIAAPLLVYNFFSWIFDEFIMVSKFIVVANAGNLFLLTSNRLISIVRPLRYYQLVTIRRTVLMIALIWAVALFVFVSAIVSSTCDCGVQWLFHITKYFLACYLVLFLFLYAYMYSVSRKHRTVLRERTRSITVGNPRDTRSEFRSLRTLLTVAGTSAACWLPMTISLFFTDRFVRPIQFHRAFVFTAPAVVLGAAMDPFIYYYRSKGFRSSFRFLLKRFREFWNLS